MATLRIWGGRPLHGEVDIGGRKNSAVAVIPASLLASGSSRLENLPNIRDVNTYKDILRAMGARSEFNGTTLTINANNLKSQAPPVTLCKTMRASYYLLGVLLGRCGSAEVGLPGGCDIGLRPIDQHIKGLEALGARIGIEHGVVKARVPAGRLRGAEIYLDVASVGATINIMLAAALAEGTTIIENAARESHVVDVANYINAMGGRVVGGGTDVIKIHGANELRGATHAIIPDEIEAATFMIATAATRGNVVIKNVVPKHLDSVAAKLKEAGARVEEEEDSMRVTCQGRPRGVNVKTLPYPGFPTDCQQAMTVFLAVAEGTSLVTETIWEGRFKHVDELQRMGSKITVEGRTAVIEGVENLSGARVHATDLRAAAALIVAGLVAKGQTQVSGVEHADRGYDRLDEKLSRLGAAIKRVEDSETGEVQEGRVVSFRNRE